VAARLKRVALIACLALTPGAAAAPAFAGLPQGAGVARAVAGQWAEALARFEVKPTDTLDPAEAYFRAVAQLELGLRGRALEGFRALSDVGGPFSGPALERAVQTLFGEGRYAEVVAWAAASGAERLQDPHALHYRVGQSHLLLGHPETAHRELEQVSAGEFLAYALYGRAQLEVAARRFGPAVDRLGEAISAAAQIPELPVAAALADTLRIARGRALYQLAANAGDLTPKARVRLAELALEQFERVGEVSIAYPEALRGIGWCALEAGDSSRALASFAAAGGMDPSRRAEDLWAQGRVYQRLTYYEEAARLYREAGEAAVANAAELMAAPSGAALGPVVEARRWERRGERAAALADARSELAARLSDLEAAAVARGRRLGKAVEQVQARRLRVEELQEELVSLASRLQAFLDEIPAAALFSPGERGRVHALGALQQRLDHDVTRIEGSLGVLGKSVFWEQAKAPQQARGKELWARLERAKNRLGEVQLVFLQALKERVSLRENELARQIETSQQSARALAGPIAAANAAQTTAVAAGEGLELRLASLRGRVAGLAQPLAALQTLAAAQAAQAETRARQARAEQLRLQADAYALDETQALHLLQEPPR